MAKRKEQLTPEIVIDRTRTKLEDARHQLEIYRSDTKPENRLRAFRHAVSDAWSSTFSLERMKGLDGDEGTRWETWWNKYAPVLKDDPLCVTFRQLRNYFEKQGGVSPGGVSVSIGSLNTREISWYFFPPRGDADFFIGDHLGRSGWKIRRPNGKVDYRYVELPQQWGIQIDYSLDNAPEVHLGEDIRGKSLVELAELYIDYLESIVDDAEEEFVEDK